MTKGVTILLKTYFGLKPGQDLRGFTDELKALTTEEKLELAQQAAADLGLKQEECSFPM